jgi:putative hydrolase of the HAD superfamily
MPASNDLIVFDLGRVLIRICDNWSHACEVAGVANSAAQLTPRAQSALHEVVCAAEVGELNVRAFADACSAILKIDSQDIVRISNNYLLGPFAGVTELLRELKRAGVMTACLSNTNENHWRLVTDPSDTNYLPLELLDYRFASHLLGMRKPEARIYEHVERQTGVAPDRITFFDDLEENVAAASNRGWDGCLIQNDTDPIAQIRKHVRVRKWLHEAR